MALFLLSERRILMTITLFLSLFTIGSAVSSLLTEALKKTFTHVSPNIVALVDAIAVGVCGTYSAYVLMGIPFTTPNIICIVLMTVCIWIGSMVGYDKVIQTISQIRR